MKIPKSMSILGNTYEVQLEDSFREGKEEMGSTCVTLQKITINNKCCKEQQASTLLHEIIEALNYHLDLDLEHKTMMGLEAGLIQVIKDNKLRFYATK